MEKFVETVKEVLVFVARFSLSEVVAVVIEVWNYINLFLKSKGTLIFS